MAKPKSEDDWAPYLCDGGSQSWSGWRDAYRIVTDGADLVAELEKQEGGGHRRGHPDLEDEFFEKFPERRGAHLIAGWLVPTADGRGYGLLYYGGSEEGIERARQAAEAWSGKPVHLLEAGRDDPKRYAIYPGGGAVVDYPEGNSED